MNQEKNTNLPDRDRSDSPRADRETTPGLELTVRPSRIARGLIALVLTLVVLGTIANVVIYHVAPTPQHKLAKLMHRFDLGHEPSIPGWYSSLALLACSILLAVIATVKRRDRTFYVYHWFGLSALFLLLALDESVMFHEMLVDTLRDRFDTHGILYFPWIVPGAVLAGVVGLISVNFLRHLDFLTRWRFVAAGVVFVGGAIGMELLAGGIVEHYGVESLRHTAVQTVEESLEMFGIVLFIHALLCYLEKYVGTIRLTADPMQAATTG